MTPDQATDEVGPFQLVRRMLLDLAQHEEHLATSEAAGVPYWRTLPPSVGDTASPPTCFEMKPTGSHRRAEAST